MNIVQYNELSQRSVRQEFARNQILEAARELFVRDGYRAFSMRRLAGGIGCAVGTLYLHFDSKEELFQTLVEQSFERLYQYLSGLWARHQDRDPVVLLKKGLFTYVEFGLRNPNDYQFAFLLRATSPEQPYRVHPAFDIMRSMVGRCIEERCFRQLDVETVAQALWAAIHGVTSLLIQRPNFPWVSRNKLIEQVINNAVDSLVRHAVPEEGG